MSIIFVNLQNPFRKKKTWCIIGDDFFFLNQRVRSSFLGLYVHKNIRWQELVDGYFISEENV